MARDLRPKHKLCRLYGEKLCDSPKCPITRRNYPAGQHGANRKHAKLSGYGKQLREKQKAKRLYGLLERQFSNYVDEASKKTGDTGMFLITYLESRLDNVVYRGGISSSRAAARQIVTHGHVTVNGKKLDIPSYRVKVGDVVAIKDSTKKSKLFESVAEKMGKIELPSWLSADQKNLSVKMLNTPTLENPQFNAKSIIEFYSR